MAGRGRGRGGAAGFLTLEQKVAFGFNDGAPAILAPPPLYGKLDARPGPLPNDEETLYCVAVKQKLVAQLKAKQHDNMEKWWPYMPAELTPTHRELAIKKRAKKRKMVKEDFVSKLAALETTENKEVELNEEDKEDEKETENKLDLEGDEGEEIEEDTEMDDGTDYADNYFDNGEGFEDEDADENEDGPVF